MSQGQAAPTAEPAAAAAAVPRAAATAVRLAAFFFVLSGAAALVYQVTWQRLLALTTGVAVYSVAIITAAFMAGLGIGSHAGGVISARLSPRRAMLAFAAIEGLLAVFAALSPRLYYDLLFRRAGWLYDGLALGSVTHFASLLPPTALMGMSLPFLVRGLVWERAGASRTIGVLYGANALGAAAGAALAPWVLLRYLAVEGAIYVGVALSLAAAAGALVVARRVPEEAIEGGRTPRGAPHAVEGTAVAPTPESAEPAQPFRLWVALYAFSGFVSLSLEMAWFRVLDVAAKGAAFTFGTLLAVYLLGLAAGTLVAAPRAPLVRRPLAVFLRCQAGIVLTTVVAHALLVWLPRDWPVVRALVEYGTRVYGLQMHAFELGEFLAIYVALPAVLFGPSTFLMGFGFPVLQRATQGDPTVSGRRVGVLQAANIAGCTLGSLVTGLLLFEAIGTSGVFRALALASAVVVAYGASAARDRLLLGLAAAIAVAAAVFPGNDRLWLRLHGSPDPEEAFVEENAASVTVLTPKRRGYDMAINGRGESWLPYGYLHTVIGAVPAVVHPAPEEVAVIGLGSGDTAWAAACRAETRDVVVFEIASSQPRLLERVADQPGMRKLREFLADPRITIVGDDGRRRLRADRRLYDLVVADSVDPDLSMATYIYSLEHYETVRARLKPGGMACVLARTPRIRAAIQRVFPFTVTLGDDLTLGSLSPIPIDVETWLERLRSPDVVDYLGGARTRLVAEHLAKAQPGRPDPRAEVNHDLVPLDEFVRPPRTP